MPTLEGQLVEETEPSLVEDPDLETRVANLERLLGLLLSDEAIGNVLKGPFRLPLAALTEVLDGRHRYAYLA